MAKYKPYSYSQGQFIPVFFNKQIQRQKAYTEYVLGTVPEDEIKLIREALQRVQLTRSERFRAEREKKLGIRLSNIKPGRPRKNKTVPLS
jgi:hypothetical protein